MGKLLDLDECGEGGDDAEGEDDDLGSRVDPEHLPLVFRAVFHDKEDDQDDDSSNEAKESEEKPLACALAIHTEVSAPLLSTWLLKRGNVRNKIVKNGTNLVNLLALHLLDLVLPNTSPHDVCDGSCDQTEMDVNLNPAMEAKDVSVSVFGAKKLLQYIVSPPSFSLPPCCCS